MCHFMSFFFVQQKNKFPMLVTLPPFISHSDIGKFWKFSDDIHHVPCEWTREDREGLVVTYFDPTFATRPQSENIKNFILQSYPVRSRLERAFRIAYRDILADGSWAQHSDWYKHWYERDLCGKEPDRLGIELFTSDRHTIFSQNFNAEPEFREPAWVAPEPKENEWDYSHLKPVQPPAPVSNGFYDEYVYDADPGIPVEWFNVKDRRR